jgi:glycosyltransferase involved in cell wall biosynthesis
MKLIGCMPVRNEAWCLGLSARVALQWCDELVILDHASIDGTREIMQGLRDEYPNRVRFIVDQNERWDEMTHRQMLLYVARHHGATHIAMIDADEILTGSLIKRNGFGQGSYFTDRGGLDSSHILQVPLYNLRGGIHRYHANGLWGNRIVSVAFADDPALHWGGDTFHQREPRGKKLTAFQPIAQGEGGVLHLWGASERRLLAKHALYQITERLRWPEKDVRQIKFMYSQCVKGGLREDPAKWTFADVPESWWAPYAQWMYYLDVDAEPWQEAEVRRLVAEHGREKFAGLDLFGVV